MSLNYGTIQNTAQFHAMTISVASPPHHLLHKNYDCNTSSAVIALTAKSLAMIDPLGLVRFAIFTFFAWCP